MSKQMSVCSVKHESSFKQVWLLINIWVHIKLVAEFLFPNKDLITYPGCEDNPLGEKLPSEAFSCRNHLQLLTTHNNYLIISLEYYNSIHFSHTGTSTCILKFWELCIHLTLQNHILCSKLDKCGCKNLVSAQCTLTFTFLKMYKRNYSFSHNTFDI